MRTFMYPARHPIPQNLSGLGADPLTDALSASITQATKVGIENAWPTIETKADALVSKYESRYMTAAIVIGGVAALALVLSIKRELGK